MGMDVIERSRADQTGQQARDEPESLDTTRGMPASSRNSGGEQDAIFRTAASLDHVGARIAFLELGRRSFVVTIQRWS
jgi:hypothetical protein